MSAYSVEQVADCRIRLGPGEPFLHKPFAIAELNSTVRAVLAYASPTNPSEAHGREKSGHGYFV